jgi:serine/threonine protein kinase
MAVAPGTRIGAYEVVSILGAGGMGEVYRARDTKLSRDVALKILPAAFTTDPDRLTRFKREAVVLASLNHPNIAAVYGFEDSGETLALVMELVEGDDLSTLIQRGTFSVADTIQIARQLAEALEAAHESGIIHRDLKPGNIKVRTDGTVKVLDFGLAKAMSPDTVPGTENAQNSPTLTARATQLGMIIGTAAYMAPEQAKGRPVDKRADIWAFGVVLYEMLTGRRAFDGEDVSTTLAAVLMKDPEWTALPKDTPPGLSALIHRCLERDPKARLRDIGEARVLLSSPEKLRSGSITEAISNDGSVRATTIPVTRTALPWLVAAAGIVIAAVGGYYVASSTQSRNSPPRRVQFTIEAPVSSVTSALSTALSPDGLSLAYAAPTEQGSSRQAVLWIRALSDTKPRMLAGTEGVTAPFWSPDSRRLGFSASGKLKWIDVAGSTPQPLCDIGNQFLGGTWNADGTILFAHGNSSSTVTLFRVSDRGGTPELVLRGNPTAKQTSLQFPHFLPDGKHFLYLAWSSEAADRSIWLGSLDGDAPRQLIKEPSNAVFARIPESPGGAILFVREGALIAQPFDSGRRTMTGDPVQIVPSVYFIRANGRASFSASTTGGLAYRQGGVDDQLSDLVWVDRAGTVLGVAAEPGPYNQIRMSPDEKRVAISVPNASAIFNIWTLDFGNRILTQTTFEEGANDPVWGPGGESIGFEAMPKGKRDLFKQELGKRGATLLYESPEDPKWLDDWSRDGRYLLYHLPRPGKLFALELVPNATPMLLAESTANFDGAHFSPDGKWVAYMSSETGDYEVWVAAFPAFDRRRRISARGGGSPFWRGDSRELYYLTAEGKLMAVAASAVPGPNGTTNLEFGAPVELFQSPQTLPFLPTDQYSVTKDGQRFLFLRPMKDPRVTVPITIRLN